MLERRQPCNLLQITGKVTSYFPANNWEKYLINHPMRNWLGREQTDKQSQITYPNTETWITRWLRCRFKQSWHLRDLVAREQSMRQTSRSYNTKRRGAGEWMVEAFLKRDDINSSRASRCTQWKEGLKNPRSGNESRNKSGHESRNKKALFTIITHTASPSLIWQIKTLTVLPKWSNVSWYWWKIFIPHYRVMKRPNISLNRKSRPNGIDWFFIIHMYRKVERTVQWAHIDLSPCHERSNDLEKRENWLSMTGILIKVFQHELDKA